MTKYIEKTAIVAEIERRLNNLTDAAFDSKIGINLRELKDFIDTFEAKELNFTSLPSNLDEAAQKVEDYYDVGEEHGYLYCHRGDIKDAFKAGAEWMAGQGVCADAEVCKLADRAWVTPLDEKLFQNEVYDKFKAGDKVVVQIRKK